MTLPRPLQIVASLAHAESKMTKTRIGSDAWTIIIDHPRAEVGFATVAESRTLALQVLAILFASNAEADIYVMPCSLAGGGIWGIPARPAPPPARDQ